MIVSDLLEFKFNLNSIFDYFDFIHNTEFSIVYYCNFEEFILYNEYRLPIKMGN